MQGIISLLLATGYLSSLAATHTGYLGLKRALAALAFTFLALGLLITFGRDNRRVAPVLNVVLPHAQLEVKQSWGISQGDRAAHSMIFQLFEVTLTSRRARGVDVDIYDFEFESNGSSYDNTFALGFRGCDLRDVAKNGTLTCLVALEVPQSATGSTLVFEDSVYKAWADVSF